MSETSRSASPTAQQIKAAEELELDDVGLEDEDLGSADAGKDSSNTSPSLKTSPIAVKKQLSPSKSDDSPKVSPVKTPGKVGALAARWEQASGSGPSTITPSKNAKSTPTSSFRSIPASSSKSSIGSSASDSRSSPSTSPTKDFKQLVDSPPRKTGKSLPEPKTPTSANGQMESFSDVPLATTPKNPSRKASQDGKSTYSLSPLPPNIELADPQPEAVQATPKSSSFTAALGFGRSSSATTSQTVIESPKPSRSTSSSSTGGGGWRSTMNNILGSKASTSTPGASSSNATTPSPAPIPPATMRSPHVGPDRSASTSFIVNRVESPTASRDRRISRQEGGPEKLREGFERVKSEMEGAAREMRHVAEGSESGEGDSQNPDRTSTTNVDWTFWGAVVQDYEEVAKTRPRELSKAIQQGIPAVIRGAIWQLMSSSKSIELEESYKALLKQTSSHEKAIAKDLSRTFPNHKFFQEAGGVGQESLFMVVKAFSLYDEDVGYTQGLAFIVAALLLNMPDEEAFCVLVRLMDSYNLRSLFLADMPGLQLRLYQFDRLMEEILPLVHTHFIKRGVKSSMFASQWFMTLFSYRFPLSLVYRVLDIVFAEGIEAIFRFSIALMRRAEDKLVELDFEQILQYLQTDLFEVYRLETDSPESKDAKQDQDASGWKANEFVRDAYEVRITPFMLDSYESEYEDICRNQNKHALELDQLRNANRSLSSQVKQLESSLATINQEHVELVRQLVMSKIEKEETENELVRYKMLYAELAHAQQDALSTHSRLSAGSAT